MTDTPTDRAALEALAEQLEHNSEDVCSPLAVSAMEAAATLRALASQMSVAGDLHTQASLVSAEPPAEEGAKPRMEQSDNMAALVEEAREAHLDLSGTAWRRIDGGHELTHYAGLIDRLAAALTAQAERAEAALARAENAEALLREAGELLDLFGVCADDWDEMGDNRIVNIDRFGKGDFPIYVSELRAARALAAKLKGGGS